MRATAGYWRGSPWLLLDAKTRKKVPGENLDPTLQYLHATGLRRSDVGQSGNDRAALLLPDLVRLAVQVNEPYVSRKPHPY
jgi:hypothetical protein